jgi:hypothetical protein
VRQVLRGKPGVPLFEVPSDQLVASSLLRLPRISPAPTQNQISRRRSIWSRLREVQNAAVVVERRNLVYPSFRGKKRKALSVDEIEDNHNFFDGRSGRGRVFPPHDGLRGIWRQHGVAALDLHFCNIPVRKHGCFQSNLSFKVTVSYDGWIFRIDHHQDFAMGFSGFLSQRMGNGAKYQEKQREEGQRKSALDLAQSTTAAIKTVSHLETRKLNVETPKAPKKRR